LYGWAAALLARRPHIWHAREIVVQSAAALRLERFLARHFATVVVAISEAVAAGLHPANVEVVLDDVDEAEFGPDHAGVARGALAEALADRLPSPAARTRPRSTRRRLWTSTHPDWPALYDRVLSQRR